MSDAKRRYAVLEDEPSSRLPVLILVDASFSMTAVKGGTPSGEVFERDGQRWQPVKDAGESRLGALLRGLASFVTDIRADMRARASVEMAIVSFGERIVIEKDFGPVEESDKTLQIKAEGNETRLGHAVKAALGLLDKRKDDYRQYGVAYYQPQLIILTDGEATDPDVCRLAAAEVQARRAANKLICLPFLIGREQGLASLRSFGPAGEVFQIDQVVLSALFKYLSQSSIRCSRSQAAGTESVSIETMLKDLRAIIQPMNGV